MNHAAPVLERTVNSRLSFDDRLQAAIDLHQNDKFEEARRIYLELSTEHPNDPKVWTLLGLTYCHEEDYAHARGALEMAVTLAPDNVPSLVHLARASFFIGHVTRSFECYELALAIDPAFPDLEDEIAFMRSQPCLCVSSALQGAHAPERQTFMSAAVDRLSSLGRPLDVLEIGSYAGASAITWASALDRLSPESGSLLCIDPWGQGASMDENGINQTGSTPEQVFECFLHNISIAPEQVPVKFEQGLSADVLPQLEDRSFDIAYVDGCHHFDEVMADLRHCDRLIRIGGIVCGDDLEVQAGQIDRLHAIAHAHHDVAQDPFNGAKYHPGVTLAVDEFFGNVSAFSGFWAMQKTRSGYAPVDLSKQRGLIPAHWGEEFGQRVREYFADSDEIAELLD